MLDILTKIDEKALLFSKNSNRIRKKAIGQFFTPKKIAEYMAESINLEKDSINLLDPGAGNGILSCAILAKILGNKNIKKVNVDLYENDKAIIDLLTESLVEIEELYKNYGKKLEYNIINEDFIIYNSTKWTDKEYYGEYDIVISNPPYKKLRKDSIECNLMKELVFGQPNIYFLFMAMSIKMLKDSGQFIFITPRSYFCGSYFIKFRKWFTGNVNIEKVTTFLSRKSVFDKEKILQETVIVKGRKNTEQMKLIEVLNIINSDEMKIHERIFVDKKTVFDKTENCYIKIPTSLKQYNALEFVNKWGSHLRDLGFKVSTGKIVDYRNREHIIDGTDITDNKIPLIWNINLKNGKFIWPQKFKDKFQLIMKNEDKKGLIKNSNYIFIRRTSSKEEQKMIQVVQYNKEFLNTQFIGIENHVNYLYKIDREINETELIGLYIIFNSSIIDNYFRVLCGSTQVNATEINSMKFPSEFDILQIGNIGENIADLTTENCDEILISYFR